MPAGVRCSQCGAHLDAVDTVPAAEVEGTPHGGGGGSAQESRARGSDPDPWSLASPGRLWRGPSLAVQRSARRAAADCGREALAPGGVDPRAFRSPKWGADRACARPGSARRPVLSAANRSGTARPSPRPSAPPPRLRGAVTSGAGGPRARGPPRLLGARRLGGREGEERRATSSTNYGSGRNTSEPGHATTGMATNGRAESGYEGRHLAPRATGLPEGPRGAVCTPAIALASGARAHDSGIWAELGAGLPKPLGAGRSTRLAVRRALDAAASAGARALRRPVACARRQPWALLVARSRGVHILGRVVERSLPRLSGGRRSPRGLCEGAGEGYLELVRPGCWPL